MSGNLGAFVQGNIFAGLFGTTVGVRLDETAWVELEAIDGSGPFGPAERPMGGYTSLPAAWRTTPEVAERWVEKALAYASSLPPKVKKPKRAKHRPAAGGLQRRCQLPRSLTAWRRPRQLHPARSVETSELPDIIVSVPTAKGCRWQPRPIFRHGVDRPVHRPRSAGSGTARWWDG